VWLSVNFEFNFCAIFEEKCQAIALGAWEERRISTCERLVNGGGFRVVCVQIFAANGRCDVASLALSRKMAFEYCVICSVRVYGPKEIRLIGSFWKDLVVEITPCRCTEL
jgi:hypothetical protein